MSLFALDKDGKYVSSKLDSKNKTYCVQCKEEVIVKDRKFIHLKDVNECDKEKLLLKQNKIYIYNHITSDKIHSYIILYSYCNYCMNKLSNIKISLDLGFKCQLDYEYGEDIIDIYLYTKRNNKDYHYGINFNRPLPDKIDGSSIKSKSDLDFSKIHSFERIDIYCNNECEKGIHKEKESQMKEKESKEIIDNIIKLYDKIYKKS
jgi:hypothetical protein